MKHRTRTSVVPVASSRNYDTPGQKFLRNARRTAIATAILPFWAVTYSVFGTQKICKSEVEYNHLVAGGIIKPVAV